MYRIASYPLLDDILRHGQAEFAQIPEQGHRKYAGAAFASLCSQLIEIPLLVYGYQGMYVTLPGIVQQVQGKKTSSGATPEDGDS